MLGTRMQSLYDFTNIIVCFDPSNLLSPTGKSLRRGPIPPKQQRLLFCNAESPDARILRQASSETELYPLLDWLPLNSSVLEVRNVQLD